MVGPYCWFIFGLAFVGSDASRAGDKSGLIKVSHPRLLQTEHGRKTLTFSGDIQAIIDMANDKGRQGNGDTLDSETQTPAPTPEEPEPEESEPVEPEPVEPEPEEPEPEEATFPTPLITSSPKEPSSPIAAPFPTISPIPPTAGTPVAQPTAVQTPTFTLAPVGNPESDSSPMGPPSKAPTPSSEPPSAYRAPVEIPSSPISSDVGTTSPAEKPTVVPKTSSPISSEVGISTPQPQTTSITTPTMVKVPTMVPIVSMPSNPTSQIIPTPVEIPSTTVPTRKIFPTMVPIASVPSNPTSPIIPTPVEIPSTTVPTRKIFPTMVPIASMPSNPTSPITPTPVEIPSTEVPSEAPETEASDPSPSLSPFSPEPTGDTKTLSPIAPTTTDSEGTSSPPVPLTSIVPVAPTDPTEPPSSPTPPPSPFVTQEPVEDPIPTIAPTKSPTTVSPTVFPESPPTESVSTPVPPIASPSSSTFSLLTCPETELSRVEIVNFEYSVESVLGDFDVLETLRKTLENNLSDDLANLLLPCRDPIEMRRLVDTTSVNAVDSKPDDTYSSDASCTPESDPLNTCTVFDGAVTLYLSSDADYDIVRYDSLTQIRNWINTLPAHGGLSFVQAKYLGPDIVNPSAIGRPQTGTIVGVRNSNTIGGRTLVLFAVGGCAFLASVGLVFYLRQHVGENSTGDATQAAGTDTFTGQGSGVDYDHPVSPFSEMLPSAYRFDQDGNMSAILEIDDETATRSSGIMVSESGFTTDEEQSAISLDMTGFSNPALTMSTTPVLGARRREDETLDSLLDMGDSRID